MEKEKLKKIVEDMEFKLMKMDALWNIFENHSKNPKFQNNLPDMFPGLVTLGEILFHYTCYVRKDIKDMKELIEDRGEDGNGKCDF